MAELNRKKVAEELRKLLVANASGEVFFGVLKLKVSQIEALNDLAGFLESGKKDGYIVQPGGTGKTLEGLIFAKAIINAGGKVLFVNPSVESTAKFAADARILCPELNIGEYHQDAKKLGDITYIVDQSLIIQVNNGTINLEDYHFIWDEAHSYMGVATMELVTKSCANETINLGLTASPKYYDGKEVDLVLPELIHALPFDLAEKRGDISKTVNLLISTDNVTGLKSRIGLPDESAAVSKALNFPARNLIVAKTYSEMTVVDNETDKSLRLFGEPMLVFCVTIKHVNDAAKQINDALMPLVKGDENFRQILRDKGINPDDVKHVAEPIHAGGDDDYEINPKDIAERNEILSRLKSRKTLMVVSTSLLQQSFDYPELVIVYDNVPRQSFVSCGQNGMRAGRPTPNVPFKVVINTSDSDRPTITYSDFKESEYKVEGISLFFSTENSGGKRSVKVGLDREISFEVKHNRSDLRKASLLNYKEATKYIQPARWRHALASLREGVRFADDKLATMMINHSEFVLSNEFPDYSNARIREIIENNHLVIVKAIYLARDSNSSVAEIKSGFVGAMISAAYKSEKVRNNERDTFEAINWWQHKVIAEELPHETDFREYLAVFKAKFLDVINRNKIGHTDPIVNPIIEKTANLFLEGKMSIKQIAESCGISASAVMTILKNSSNQARLEVGSGSKEGFLDGVRLRRNDISAAILNGWVKFVFSKTVDEYDAEIDSIEAKLNPIEEARCDLKKKVDSIIAETDDGEVPKIPSEMLESLDELRSKEEYLLNKYHRLREARQARCEIRF